MADKKQQLKTFRLDSDIEKMLIEMSEETMRSQNHMVNFCIKEYYNNIFKEKNNS